MHARTTWLTIAAAFVLGLECKPAPQQQDPDPLNAWDPKVQRIWRRYAAAIGGSAQVAPIRTREILGRFEYTGVGQHATGRVEMRWKAPSSIAEHLRGPMGVITRGFDGERAWGSHPQTGVRQLSSFEIDEMLLEGVLYQPLGVQQWYAEPSYEGRVRIAGRDLEVLSASRHGGRIDRFYFDPVGGLPVRLDLWEEGPEAVRTGRSGDFYLAHYDLEDYRIVEGMSVPFLIRRRRPNSTMTFWFTEVRHNIQLPDSIFRAPIRTHNP